MIQMTPSAITKAKEAIAGDTSKSLRIYVEAGGCSGFQYGLTIDDKHDDDNVFEFDGLNMAIDPASYEYLKDVTVDYKEGLEHSGFTLENPAAKSTCGCGKSSSF